MPHSDISAAFAAMSHEPKINRRGFVRPTLTCLPFVPRDNKYYKMVSKYGKLYRVCLFGKVLRILLAQIVLGSDYSEFVKGLLQPVLRNVGLKKSLKRKKKNRQNDLWTSQGMHFSYMYLGSRETNS